MLAPARPFEKKPGTHEVHDVLPALIVALNPEAHAQTLAAASQTVFGAEHEQLALPATDVAPVGQPVHVEAPKPGVKQPLAQATHAPPAALADPGEHRVQLAAPIW